MNNSPQVEGQTNAPACPRFPPKPIIAILCFWIWSIAASAIMAFFQYPKMNLSLSAGCVAILIGLCLRWRLAFWISVMGLASTIGGTIAITTAQEHLPTWAIGRLAIAFVALITHQVQCSFQWFGFKNVRQIRLLLWLASVAVCSLTNIFLFRAIPKVI
jgi:hypothetical protein